MATMWLSALLSLVILLLIFVAAWAGSKEARRRSGIDDQAPSRPHTKDGQERKAA